jgi:serine/threonine-protein kinase
MGYSWQRPIDDMVMVYVPDGLFDMGNNHGEPWSNDDLPVHKAILSAFWIDQTEVTNAQYARFLNEAGNQKISYSPADGLHTQFQRDRDRGEGDSWLHIGDGDERIMETSEGEFEPETGFEDHPVVEVSWYGADAYCSWVGGQLPSEAQWEYAARGRDEPKFPWGNNEDGTKLNCWNWADDACLDGYGETSPVGKFPEGRSWVNALDMAGNVFDWTNDWYSLSYYQEVANQPELNNPPGPDNGTFKVSRGGS